MKYVPPLYERDERYSGVYVTRPAFKARRRTVNTRVCDADVTRIGPTIHLADPMLSH